MDGFLVPYHHPSKWFLSEKKLLSQEIKDGEINDFGRFLFDLNYKRYDLMESNQPLTSYLHLIPPELMEMIFKFMDGRCQCSIKCPLKATHLTSCCLCPISKTCVQHPTKIIMEDGELKANHSLVCRCGKEYYHTKITKLVPVKNGADAFSKNVNFRSPLPLTYFINKLY